MPISDIHKKKLKKNLMIALLIFLWCAVIWAVTMIKIAKADEPGSVPNPYSQQTPVANPYGDKAPVANPYGDKRPVSNPYSGENPVTSPYADKKPVHYHYRGRDYTGIGIPPKAADRKGALYKQRFEHRETTAATKEEWDAAYYENSDTRHNRTEDINAARRTHGDKIYMTKDSWDKTYLDSGERRLEQAHDMRRQRAAHRDEVAAKPRGWWDEWSAEQEIKKAEQMR